MSDCWKLVCEKTATCESTGTSSAFSTDRRYPVPGSNARLAEPSSIFRTSSETSSVRAPAVY